MQVRLLFTLLWSILWVSVPSALAQTNPPTVRQINDASKLELTVKKPLLDLSAHWVAAAGLLLGGGALGLALQNYRDRQRWRRVNLPAR